MLAVKQPRALLTREKILREATRLLTRKGFHDTKLEEILRAAQVTSGAFFHHFRSKEDLAFAVMDWYLEQRRRELEELDTQLAAAGNEPLSPVCRWLDATAERFRGRAARQESGCIYGNLSTALADTHAGFRQRLAACFDQMAADFEPRLEAVRRRCCPDRQVDTLVLARYIVAVIEGSIILARAHQDAEIMARHFEMLKEHLRQVLRTDGSSERETAER